MPGSTPIYSWTYQSLADAPDGPDLGETLALDIEATVSGLATSLDARLDTAESNIGIIDGRDQYLATRVASHSNTAAAAAGVEAVALTLPSFTYKAGQAYRITTGGGVQAGTAATPIQMRVRKTGLGGQALGELYRVHCGASGVPYMAHGSIYIRVGGADVTAQIALTITGTGTTALQYANSESPRWMQAERVGTAGGYGDATLLV